MSHWRRFHYCASAAVVVTALAVFFGGMGGELILMPGMIARGGLELMLTLLFTTGDDFYFLPRGSHAVLAAVFCFASVYVISFVRAFVKAFVKEGKR